MSRLGRGLSRLRRAGRGPRRLDARSLQERQRARRRWRIAGLAIGAVAVALAGLTGYRFVRLTSHLSHARDNINAAEAAIRSGQVASARQRLELAASDLVQATNSLHGRELELVGLLPVLHQNVRAVQRSVTVALRMAVGGEEVIDAAKPLQAADGHLQLPIRGGQVSLDTATAVQARLQQLAFDLPGAAERPSSRWLIGRVSSLQARVYGEAAARRQEFATVGRAIDLLGEMTGANGPRRYMIAVANEAEMRGTGGMILSYGILSSQDGKLSLDRFGPIDELKLTGPVDTSEPADYLARYADLKPRELWRSVTLASDFTVVAPTMEAMFTKATGLPVDGVIQVDSYGLAAILQGIGPVTVPDLGEVNADNVVPLTINEAYTRFPDRPVRQEYLGSVAEAVFRKLVSGDFGSLRPLAAALVVATQQRHVIMHTTHPDPQRSVSLFGGTGELPPEGVDFSQLVVQNFGANKLDYYLDSSLRLTGSLPAGRLGKLHAVVTVANTAPPGGRPAYVFGPGAPGFNAGDYHGMVELYLPSGASLAKGGPTGPDAPTSVTENGRTVITYPVVIASGATSTVTFDIVMPPRPPGPAAWALVPAPRVHPTQVDLDLTVDGGAVKWTGPVVESVVRKAR